MRAAAAPQLCETTTTTRRPRGQQVTGQTSESREA